MLKPVPIAKKNRFISEKLKNHGNNKNQRKVRVPIIVTVFFDINTVFFSFKSVRIENQNPNNWKNKANKLSFIIF